MKNLYTLLRSFAPTVLKLPVLGLAAMVMLLSGGAPRTETADGTGSGFTTFDAPGAGTTASALQGTAAFSINAAGARRYVDLYRYISGVRKRECQYGCPSDGIRLGHQG